MARKKGTFIWTIGRLTVLNRMMATGRSMEEMATCLCATHAQVEYRIALMRKEAAPGTVEVTAGERIHPHWLDENYMRNLIEMAERRRP